MRLLIAEDDLTSRSMLAAVLKKVEYEVVETALTAPSAWDMSCARPTPPSWSFSIG